MPGNPLVLAVALAAALGLDFLPAMVADRLTLALFNAVLGGTVVGWLPALLWSFQRNPPDDLAAQVGERRRSPWRLGFSHRLAHRVGEREARLAQHAPPEC